MRVRKWWLITCLLLLLPACNADQREVPETRQQVSATLKLHHLHMLINHSLQMATQGADMNLLGIEHGPAMLDKASNLLNRAMSGPEMANMHKIGHADTVLMKLTHDLAAKSVELIKAMKAFPADAQDRQSLLMLNHAIEIAATGNSMIMQGQQGMAGDVDAVMVNHGQMMLGEASGIIHGTKAGGEYKQLATEVVSMLIGIPDMPAPETPKTPDSPPS